MPREVPEGEVTASSLLVFGSSSLVFNTALRVGGHGGNRAVHLVKWEVLTKPKKDGGANLRRVREMNWALIAKLAWRVWTSEGQAWCDVLRAKYGFKQGWSSL